MKNIDLNELINLKPAAQEEILRDMTLDELQKIPKDTWRLIDAQVRISVMPLDGANFHLSQYTAMERIFERAGGGEHAYALLGYMARLLCETLLISPHDVPTEEEIIEATTATPDEAFMIHVFLLTAIPEAVATRSSAMCGSIRKDAKKAAAPKTPTTAEIRARRART